MSCPVKLSLFIVLSVVEATLARSCFAVESRLGMEGQWAESIHCRLPLRMWSQALWARDVLAASLAVRSSTGV